MLHDADEREHDAQTGHATDDLQRVLAIQRASQPEEDDGQRPGCRQRDHRRARPNRQRMALYQRRIPDFIASQEQVRFRTDPLDCAGRNRNQLNADGGDKQDKRDRQRQGVIGPVSSAAL